MASTINASTSAGLVNTADTSGVLQLQTANTAALTIDASQNVGIGTATPASKLHVYGATDSKLTLQNSNNSCFVANLSGSMYVQSADIIGFNTGGATERMRIDSSGNLLVGQSSTIGTGGRVQVISNTDTLYSQTSSNTAYAALILNVQNTAARLAAFQYGNTTAVGTITTNGTTTSYNVTSDYRLKENIVPLTGALAKITQLKPSVYNYKSKPEESIEGFIAHELQSVIPHAVTGDKDAVDADEKPIYQGVDASFLIPHLVAAIQELKAINDTQAETINALTARIVALEGK